MHGCDTTLLCGGSAQLVLLAADRRYTGLARPPLQARLGTALQPYLDTPLVELRYWPLRRGTDRPEGYSEQDKLMVLCSTRLRKYAQWVLEPNKYGRVSVPHSERH